jgi:hypothetical protein
MATGNAVKNIGCQNGASYFGRNENQDIRNLNGSEALARTSGKNNSIPQGEKPVCRNETEVKPIQKWRKIELVERWASQKL